MHDLVRRGCLLTLMLTAGLAIAPLAAAGADSQAPALAWAEQIQLDAIGGAVAVGVRGPQTIVVVGPDPGEKGTSELRAYDTGSGEMIWKRAARALPDQIITDLDVGKSLALVVSTAADSNALVVRARAAEDGFNEWARIAFLPADRVEANDLVLSGPRVFVLGAAGDYRMVRALDWEDGTFLWSDTPYEDDTDSLLETVAAGTVNDSRLIVAGSRRRSPADGNSATFFRQYRVRDGEVTWDVEVGDAETTIGGLAGVVPDIVVVAATAADPATTDDRWVVYAVSADTGEPLWTDMPYRLPSGAEAVVYDPDSGTVFVAGWVTGARILPVVRAYDAATGELLWEGGAGDVKEGAYRAMTLVDGAVVAAGEGRLPGANVESPLLEGLDPETGATLWSQVDAAQEGRGSFHAVDAHEDRIAAAGRQRPRGDVALVHVYRLPE